MVVVVALVADFLIRQVPPSLGYCHFDRGYCRNYSHVRHHDITGNAGTQEWTVGICG